MRFSALMAALGALVLLVAVGTPTADARLTTVTKRIGPFTTAPYSVRYGTTETPAPRLDGHVVAMHARVVDAAGRPKPVSTTMLHHATYLSLARRDKTYCKNSSGQRFYGTGEDEETFAPPAGFGYPVAKKDRWKASWMLMNHLPDADDAYIEYTATIDDSPAIEALTPYWVGIVRCTPDPQWSIKGNGIPGSVERRARRWTVPKDGRIVFATTHLHGGAKSMEITEPACGGRRLVSHKPLYGRPEDAVYRVKPVLHEPGPITASTWSSPTGIAVRAGETLTARTFYDAQNLHTRVMGIEHLYVAEGSRPAASARAEPRCAEPPADVVSRFPDLPGRFDAPLAPVGLTGLDRAGIAGTIQRPPGPITSPPAGRRSVGVDVGDFAISRPNLVVDPGTRVTWRFTRNERHDITVVDGPVGFAAPQHAAPGQYTRTLTKPGAYKLLCTLHPILMTQRIDVRQP